MYVHLPIASTPKSIHATVALGHFVGRGASGMLQPVGIRVVIAWRSIVLLFRLYNSESGPAAA